MYMHHASATISKRHVQAGGDTILKAGLRVRCEHEDKQ